MVTAFASSEDGAGLENRDAFSIPMGGIN